MVSASATFSIRLPLGPALAWKRFVVADLAFLLLLGLWAFAVVSGRRPVRALRHWRAPLLLLAGIGAAVAFSPDPARGLPDLARFAYSLTAFVLIAQLPLDRSRVRRFAGWYVGGAVAICALAVAAYVAYTITGWPAALVEPGTGARDQAHLALRMKGPFAQPNPLAVFLTSALFFAGVLLLVVERRRTRRLVLLALAAFGLVLLLTSSRNMGSVLLALAAWSLLSPHTRPWHGARTLLLGQLALAWILVVVTSILWAVVPISVSTDPQTRFATIRFYTAPEARALIYPASLRMFLDRPLVGVGPGLFGEHFRRHVALPDLQASLRHLHRGTPEEEASVVSLHRDGPDPHSSWLGWLARAGLVGMGGIAVFFGWLAVRLLRARRALPPVGALATLGFGFLLAFLSDGFTGEILHLRFLWVFLAFVTALTDREFA